MSALRPLWIALALLGPTVAVAQSADPARELLPEGADDDPIGIGDTHTLRDVPTTPPPPPVDPNAPPRAPDVDVSEGAVLGAIPGVREIDHRVEAQLRDGRVEVRVEMRFINRARYRAELRYRLAVPPGAMPGALEVCRADRCRSGAPDDTRTYDDAVRARGPSELPVADVRVDGDHLVFRAAPSVPGETLTLRLTYFAEAPTHGGITHLRLPPRGRDARIAPARVSFTTDELLAPAVDGRPASGPVEVEAWEGVTLSATHRSGGGAQVSLQRFPCGDATCARLHASAGPRTARRERVVLLLDASPSMRGPARGRMGAALASLLGSMHPRSEVRALAFAGTARPLLETWTAPDEVPLTSLGRASTLELGAATRFEAAWGSVRARRGDHWILVGDGGLTASREGIAAAQAARDAGVRVSVLNLADRGARPALGALVERTGGLVVQAGPEAGLATRARSVRLDEKVAALSAPAVAPRVTVLLPGGDAVELGPLLAGEAVRWSGLAPRGTRFLVGSERRPSRAPRDETAFVRAYAAVAHPAVSGRLAAVAPPDRSRPSMCESEGPVQRAGGVSTDEAPVILAEARSCAPPTPPAPAEDRMGRGVPAETVLSMLRRRVVPAARRCFRIDRAGRGDYSVRAVFELELADREISGAAVHGEISERLRSCLMASLEGLDVPIFRGSVLVRYPLYTERHPPPPTVELRDDVAAPVDRVLRD